VATSTTKGHGRLEKYTLTSSALLNETSDWPSLGQVFQLVREVTYLKSGKTTREVWYGITSLPPAAASACGLLTLNRQHWAIENKLHYCRDVTFHEMRAPCVTVMPLKPLPCLTIWCSACCACVIFRPSSRPVVASPLVPLRRSPSFLTLSSDFANARQSLVGE
jgi:hypothetical protein